MSEPVAAPLPAVDAHNHLGRWLSLRGRWVERDLAGNLDEVPWSVRDVPGLVELMDRLNLTAIVNLDGRWGGELEANLDRYDRAHPGRFATFCQLDWREAARPNFATRLVESLQRSATAGARGLKVWKTLGLGFRGPEGKFLLPDDPRIGPVWEEAAALELPVWIHVADPPAYFEPVDERNPARRMLLANPDWSYADPSFPRHDRLIDALEAICAAHRSTTFVGAHLASCAHDLERVGRLLDAHPNLYLDISARVVGLARRPAEVRPLIMRHPERVLFGTDAFPPNVGVYARYFEFLSGLDLPADALRDVMSGNARRLLRLS